MLVVSKWNAILITRMLATLLHGLIRRLCMEMLSNWPSSTFLTDSFRCNRRKDLVISEKTEKIEMLMENDFEIL